MNRTLCSWKDNLLLIASFLRFADHVQILLHLSFIRSQLCCMAWSPRRSKQHCRHFGISRSRTLHQRHASTYYLWSSLAPPLSRKSREMYGRMEAIVSPILAINLLSFYLRILLNFSFLIQDTHFNFVFAVTVIPVSN